MKWTPILKVMYINGVNVEPQDSISNVGSNAFSKRSGRTCNVSKGSSRSTALSTRLRAEAAKAALMTRAAALQRKHALEEQEEQLSREEEQLRRGKEQLEFDNELAASTAKLAVSNASKRDSVLKAHSDGMESYFKKGIALDPQAALYKPQQKE